MGNHNPYFEERQTKQKKKDKRVNNNIQNTAHKTKDRVNKGNNKITELRTILQRESQNS
jgi:hypothetical protein